MLSRLIYGTRTSLIVGFIPMIITICVGTTIGLSAANNDVDLFAAMARTGPVLFSDPDGYTTGTVTGGLLVTETVNGVSP